MDNEFLKVDRVTLDKKLSSPPQFPKRGNKIIHSHHYKGSDFEYVYDRPALSLKYVIRGMETYRLDNQTHQVYAGEFLLVNQGRNYETFGHASQEWTEGICIYICPQLLEKVNYALTHSDEQLMDDPKEAGCNCLEFLEKVFRHDENEVGFVLQKLAREISYKDDPEMISSYSFFSYIAEKMLVNQNQISQKINRLKTVKKSTREELFKRLEIARSYIDDHYSQKLSIPQIAKEAALSEYHFYRSFKQVYQMSPYQYLLKRRLHKAYEFLGLRQATVTEAAYLTGFSDIHAFSKAFKKEFQISPAKVKKA